METAAPVSISMLSRLPLTSTSVRSGRDDNSPIAYIGSSVSLVSSFAETYLVC